jgi:putative aldouronate transport system substrate-binding protein
VESGIQNLNDKLYANGMQDIIDAKQEQLDAWLANQ